MTSNGLARIASFLSVESRASIDPTSEPIKPIILGTGPPAVPNLGAKSCESWVDFLTASHLGLFSSSARPPLRQFFRNLHTSLNRIRRVHALVSVLNTFAVENDGHGLSSRCGSCTPSAPPSARRCADFLLTADSTHVTHSLSGVQQHNSQSHVCQPPCVWLRVYGCRTCCTDQGEEKTHLT